MRLTVEVENSKIHLCGVCVSLWTTVFDEDPTHNVLAKCRIKDYYNVFGFGFDWVRKVSGLICSEERYSEV